MHGPSAVNPFVAFGLADCTVEDIMRMPQGELNKLYRQRAFALHPDKAPPEKEAETTAAFQALETAKQCLFASRDKLNAYAQTHVCL